MGAKSDVSNRTRSEKGKLASRRNFACLRHYTRGPFPAGPLFVFGQSVVELTSLMRFTKVSGQRSPHRFEGDEEKRSGVRAKRMSGTMVVTDALLFHLATVCWGSRHRFS
jgi:hypothetical protein